MELQAHHVMIKLNDLEFYVIDVDWSFSFNSVLNVRRSLTLGKGEGYPTIKILQFMQFIVTQILIRNLYF